jgi:hypothetical protein
LRQSFCVQLFGFCSQPNEVNADAAMPVRKNDIKNRSGLAAEHFQSSVFLNWSRSPARFRFLALIARPRFPDNLADPH